MNNKAKAKNIRNEITYVNNKKKNDSNEILETVYITILWGAPIGRIMHPTLAAMVSKETASIAKSVLPTFFKAKIVNGTNRIKETSFVMNIELKKHMKTRTETSSRAFPILVINLRSKISKTAKFLRISTITIITKSNIIVSQLI